MRYCSGFPNSNTRRNFKHFIFIFDRGMNELHYLQEFKGGDGEGGLKSIYKNHYCLSHTGSSSFFLGTRTIS